MNVFGLTGGVGMGKSATAAIIARSGVPVIDTDDIARELVLPGQPALAEIRQLFGNSILQKDNSLDRPALARIVFADHHARQQLENILHPRIRLEWMKRVERLRDENFSTAVVVIPLLYETDAAGFFDSVICVSCRCETQLARLHKRGWNENQLRQRITAQWPVEKKMRLADYVIWTEGDLEVTAEQVRRIFH